MNEKKLIYFMASCMAPLPNPPPQLGLLVANENAQFRSLGQLQHECLQNGEMVFSLR